MQKETRLILAICLSSIFMLAEVVGGYLANSIAIYSDAAHLLTDIAGFGIALIATIAAKSPGTKTLTYGMARAEVFGAMGSIFSLWIITVFLLYAAFCRTVAWFEGAPEHVDGRLMFLIACFGVAVNICLGAVFHEDHGGAFHPAHAHDHDHDTSSSNSSSGGDDGHDHHHRSGSSKSASGLIKESGYQRVPSMDVELGSVPAAAAVSAVNTSKGVPSVKAAAAAIDGTKTSSSKNCSSGAADDGHSHSHGHAHQHTFKFPSIPTSAASKQQTPLKSCSSQISMGAPASTAAATTAGATAGASSDAAALGKIRSAKDLALRLHRAPKAEAATNSVADITNTDAVAVAATSASTTAAPVAVAAVSESSSLLPAAAASSAVKSYGAGSDHGSNCDHVTAETAAYDHSCHDHGHDHGHEHSSSGSSSSCKHTETAAAAHRSSSNSHDHSHGHHGHGGDVNIEAAYLHVLTDLIQSIGVAIAGLVLWFKPHWQIIDPICTLVFSVVALKSTVPLLARVFMILFDGAPSHVDWELVMSKFEALSGVDDVHDLHIWSISSDSISLTCHMRSSNPQQTLLEAHDVCRGLRIDHATIQVHDSCDTRFCYSQVCDHSDISSSSSGSSRVPCAKSRSSQLLGAAVA